MPYTPLPHIINTSIDLKANGEPSRMRNHKGNIPSLPQTKSCHLCHAKFTRATHLSRHLRSHSNERAHRCADCSAEFTRSDLLSRHKKTCGDASKNANRSRRKACQACAESKVKCNLEQPCSKCSTKGKECIFLNDPGTSRNERGLVKRGFTSPSASPIGAEVFHTLDGLVSSGPSSGVSHISHVEDIRSHIISPDQLNSQLVSRAALELAGVPNVSDGSSACSSCSSPRLDSVDSHQNLSNGFNTSFDRMGLDSGLDNFFPNVCDPYKEDPFKLLSCLPRAQPDPDGSPWFEPCSAYSGRGPYVYAQPHWGVNHDQIFVKTSHSRQPFRSYSPGNYSAPTSPAPISGNPTTEELNQYLDLFFTEFSTHIPLFHRPTWQMECTHPVLVKAMRACGALFTETFTATNFINTTLTFSGEVLLLEFSKPSCTQKDHISLMLAVVLLQSIGLLQSGPEQISLSRIYHDILLTMISKTGLNKVIGSWPPPDLCEQASLESTWNDWARYETLKRLLVLAYLQDCSSCIYYSTPPAFLGLEVDINLPCDDALWRAQTSAEWYNIQRMPSAYGMGVSRMLGTNMQFALASLKDRGTSLVPCTVSPFSSFVLIHSILRDIFSTHNTRTPHGSSPHSDHGAINGVNTIQWSLHNWQKMWSANPETTHSGESSQGLPFVSDAIPFYWLARVAEAAIQNGTILVGPAASMNDTEDRYQLLKAWLVKISSCLRSGSQILLDEFHIHQIR